MRYVFLALLWSVCFVPLSYAEVNLTPFNQGAALEVSPAYPAPQSPFTVTLNDYSLSGQATKIEWLIDSVVVPDFTNKRSIALTAKTAGATTVVTLRLTVNGGGIITQSQRITPIYVDVVVEPQTRTPPFYLGRALPSGDSSAQVTAVISGTDVATENLFFTWRVGGQVIEGGALRGRSTLSVPLPADRSVLLGLEVKTLTGEIIATRIQEITLVEPKIYFYETSSLYGLKSKPFTALNLTGPSVTVRAEPYYLDIATYNSPDLVDWQINSSRRTNPSSNPYEVTVASNAAGASGKARLDLHIRNTSRLGQGAYGDAQINF